MVENLESKVEKAMRIIEGLRREIYDAKRLEELEETIIGLKEEIALMKAKEPKDLSNLI
jgi:hypothetical protein